MTHCQRLTVKLGPDIRSFIYRHALTGKPEQQQFTSAALTRPALAVGGVAQLAATHCPNKQILDPQ